MALLVETYPNPTNPLEPLTDAYAWVFRIGLEMGQNSYWVEIWVHLNEAVASLIPPPSPLDRFVIHAGDELIPETETEPAFVAPSLLEVFAMAAAAQASHPSLDPLGAFKAVVYSLAAMHHRLSPCTVV